MAQGGVEGHAPGRVPLLRGLRPDRPGDLPKVAKGALRIQRSTPNPFDAEGGYSDYTQSFHAPSCAFEAFARSKCTSKVPTDPASLSHFDELVPGDKKAVRSALDAFSRERTRTEQCPPPPKTAADLRRARPSRARP